MSSFFDTSILYYVIETGSRHGSAATRTILAGGFVSVQVLNELTNSARQKLRMPWGEIQRWRGIVMQACHVVPLTEPLQAKAMTPAERYQLIIYDASIWAAAVLSGCKTLYSEDMGDGLTIEGTTLQNPFNS